VNPDSRKYRVVDRFFDSFLFFMHPTNEKLVKMIIIHNIKENRVKFLYTSTIITVTILVSAIFPVLVQAGSPDSSPGPGSGMVKVITDATDFTSAQKDNRSVMPGVIVIKFKENAAELNSTLSKESTLFNKNSQRFQISAMEPVFPFLSAPIDDKKFHLKNIYYLKFNQQENPVKVAEAFSADPEVEYAEPKYVYPLLEIPNDPEYSSMTQFPFVRADSAWGIIKGGQGNVVVAAVDGGTDWHHQDLLSNIWTNPGEIADNGIDDDNNGYIDDVHGWNFANNSNDPTGIAATPQSAAHGTHVGGIMAGVTNNERGISSISWNCRLMPVNVSDPYADRSIAYGYEGIVYASSNGADVINCSWGALGGSSHFEQEVINYAYSEGALVVAAAGNDNNNNDINPHYPSNYQHVLSVGAISRDNDTKAYFSNYGVSVDVFAPGVNIQSTVPGNNYQSMSGTSMASPMVAGLAGLLKTFNPSLTVDQLREQIREAAVSIDGSNVSFPGLLGKGRIDALNTVTDFNHPAIRIAGVSFTESDGDGIIQAGETVDAEVSFTNFLNPANNITISLLNNSNNVTILNGSGILSALNPGDTLAANFQFVVGSGTPDGSILQFTTEISSGNYTDRDIFRLIVNPPQFADLNTGILQTAFTTQGNIGWIDFQGDQAGGRGFVYKGEDFLYEGGLLVGTSSTSLSDCIRGADQGIQDDDFRPAANEFLQIISPGPYSLQEGSILLVDSLASNPLGVMIYQKTFADSSENNNDFVIFQYEIRNPTASAVSNLYVGLFFDWDIIEGANVNNFARYDQERRMGYVQNTATNPTKLVASKLLTSSASVSYRSIDNPAEIYDGFTTTEKWNFLSGGLQTQIIDNKDVSTILSEGPFTVPANQSITVAFALIGGSSLSELQANADDAQNFYDNPSLNITPANSSLPESFVLNQNYPNPFNPNTVISYSIPATGQVNLRIYNILGQEIRRLVDRSQKAGNYRVTWDARDTDGQRVPSGIYFYKMTYAGKGQQSQTRKMMLLK
jgi:serine protease